MSDDTGSDELQEIIQVPGRTELTLASDVVLPALFANAGERASRRVIEFFTAQIRNKNTRTAYAHAVARFASWCEDRGIDLERIEPIMVAAYVEELGESYSVPTTKQHLAAIRMLFDWLVTGHIMEQNPAAAVRGPKHSTRRGKTPVLTADQARQLLDSIPLTKKDGTPDVAGLRDRALIGIMVYSFGRVSAVCGMQVGDYYQDGKRWWFRLSEKGGKQHQIPAHHNAEAYLDAYLESVGIEDLQRSPLFRTVDRRGTITERQMTRNDVFRMIKRRARAAGLPESTCCHTFRATGITTYLDNGGTIENAQNIAGHASIKTTKLYDRTSDDVTLDEIERIAI
ncbi:MAG: tyrosine-type recombinase/integrase [Planctomycetota bacterium]